MGDADRKGGSQRLLAARMGECREREVASTGMLVILGQDSNRVAIEDKEKKYTRLLIATTTFSKDFSLVPVMARPKFASFLRLRGMTIKIAACERQRERLPPSAASLPRPPPESGQGTQACASKIKGK